MKSIALISVLFISTAARCELSLSELNEMLRARGPSRALNYLSYPFERWVELEGKVGSDDAGWVRLGLQLYRVSDASASFTLEHALAKAFPYNPTAFTVDAPLSHIVCNRSYYELSTLEDTKRYISAMKEILLLQSISGEFKARCSIEMEGLEKNIEGWNGEAP
ncbi:MAG: hypothetical protein ACOY3E_00045 [Pseudomonadota bacterium]